MSTADEHQIHIINSNELKDGSTVGQAQIAVTVKL